MSAPTSVLPAWLARTPPFYAPVAIAVALAAGATLLEQPPGLGLTLTALAIFAATAATRPTRDPWRLGWWGLACALALMVTVRDAPMVRDLSLAGALLFGALAAGGFTTFRHAVRTAARTAAGMLPGPVLVLAAAAARVRIGGGRAFAAVRGVVLAGLLLAPFAALFAAADAAFAQWLAFDLPDTGDVPLRLLIAGAVLAVAGALLRIALSPPAQREGEPGRAPIVGRTEWLIALAALNALFALFVALQLAGLFGGHDHVLRTAGLTYAEYAREGFGQLVAVAALTLAVIAGARRWTVRDGAQEETLQRLLLGGLCVLTLVILLSAHRRLALYVDAFGMTRNRAYAQWEILWLGGLFLLVLLAHSRAWLPRAAVAFTGIALLLLGVSNPDARIAQANVNRYESTGKLDQGTLYDLSADAAPALARLSEREGCFEFRPEAHDGLAGFNLSRHRAHALSCR